MGDAGGVHYPAVMTDPKNAAELATAISRLAHLSPATRAKRARELMALARTILSEVADEAVDEARKAGMSYEELADMLGHKSVAMVNKAITRNRRRVRAASQESNT